MNTKYKFITFAIRFLVIAAGLVAFDNTSFAASLTVTVQRSAANTPPIANAQVCVSSSSGVLSNNTNSQGTVVFANAPQGDLTVTASAKGFVGQSIQFTMGTVDKTEVFILNTGSGGPVCTVTPPPPPPPDVKVSTVTLNPSSVIGGNSVQATVTLTSAAPPGGTTVALSTDNTSIATVPSSTQVNSGSLSQTFTVTTSPVASQKFVKITASAGGVSNSAVLTVNPPPVASLRVIVGTQTTPISGAAVCVTPSSGGSRSAVTDLTGTTVFDGVAQGSVTITVSKASFTGQSHTSTLPAGGGTARFIMTDGTGGPVCGAQPPPPPTTPPILSISSFDWHVNRKTPLFFEVALAFNATTTPGGPVIPTAYRVGETSDLNGKPFIPFQGGVAIFQLGYKGNSLTAYGQRTLFLQVKQGDLVSDVKSKAVTLEPRPDEVGEFRLTGTELVEMLRLAQTNGYPFRTREVSVTQSACTGVEQINVNTASFNTSGGGLKDRAWIKVIEANLLELSSKRFTPGWRVKSIDIRETLDLASQQSIAGAADGDGFRVTITITQPAKPDADPKFCLLAVFTVRAIVLEGPTDDMALDQTRRWKNMFPGN
jgi:hypothetical protein